MVRTRPCSSFCWVQTTSLAFLSEKELHVLSWLAPRAAGQLLLPPCPVMYQPPQHLCIPARWIQMQKESGESSRTTSVERNVSRDSLAHNSSLPPSHVPASIPWPFSFFIQTRRGGEGAVVEVGGDGHLLPTPSVHCLRSLTSLGFSLQRWQWGGTPQVSQSRLL